VSQTTRLRVKTPAGYDVVIGRGVVEELASLLPDGAVKVAILHPVGLRPLAEGLRPKVRELGLETHLIEVPDGERAKTAEVLSFCWSVLGSAGFTRTDVLIGLGGGTTTDLAGFVAATWLRGVRFVTIPTSVLGMVDAAVGGKTGINTDDGKNLVGSFHEPAGVLCDLAVLSSLPANEVRSGLAEVVKCGFIADPAILDLVENQPAAATDVRGDVLLELITRGISVKADIVAGDLTESVADGTVGRAALNYGHTLAHAIERHEHYAFRHGAAVAIGMVFAAELAQLAGRIDDQLVRRHRSVLNAVGLPIGYKPGAWDELYAAMRLDKKAQGDQLRFVVLDGLAQPAFLTGPDQELLTAAYAEITN